MSEGNLDAGRICRTLIERAQALGADAAEAVFAESTTTRIKVYGGEVEELKTAGGKGIGLRYFKDSRMGYAYAADPSEEDLEWIAGKARSNASVAEPDEHNGLPSGCGSTDVPGLAAEGFEAVPTEDKVAIAMEMERAAASSDSRIRLVEESSYVDGSSSFTIANTDGFTGSYLETDCYGFVYLMAGEDPATETGYSFTVGKGPGELEPAGAGREAAKRALIMLGSRRVPSCRVPVVFDPFAGIQILSVLARGLAADAVQKGRSPFAGRLGEAVASPAVTILDDGAMPGGIASAPFDGEGVPTGRTELIKDGRLTSFMYDGYTGRVDGRQSTGNARRMSYASGPEVGPGNFRLEPGKKQPEELLSAISEGFYVMELSGLHSGANPVTGQFSVGAFGLWIEGGAPAYGVRGVTVAGRLEDMLKGITEVADDLRWVPMGGAFGTPTFTVAEMTVGGE